MIAATIIGVIIIIVTCYLLLCYDSDKRYSDYRIERRMGITEVKNRREMPTKMSFKDELAKAQQRLEDENK